MRPNFFDHARSELTQDAVLAWLLRWADPKYREAARGIHETGRSFLSILFQTANLEGAEQPINKVTVETQVKGVDIVAVINDNLHVLIEDKVGTRQHGNQLERYLTRMQREYGEQKVVPFYLKTGNPNPAERRQAEEDGYHLFLRKDMLQVIESDSAQGADNDILNDFRVHLRRIEDETAAFRSRSCDAWGRLAWEGFFLELEESIEANGWDYVPNRSGGFMGLWWHSADHPLGRTYLQIENGRLAFKLTGVPEGDDRRGLCHRWAEVVKQAAEGTGLAVRRTRHRSGQYMTFAELRDDFRQTVDEGLLDFDATLNALRSTERIHSEAWSTLAP